MAADSKAAIEIQWPLRPIQGNEKTLIQILIPNGKKESGRGRDLPKSRQMQIEKCAAPLQMNLMQALSLRRQLIRATPGFRFETKDMGSQSGQIDYSQKFEDATAVFLKKNGIEHLNDNDQKALCRDALVQRAVAMCGDGLTVRMALWAHQGRFVSRGRNGNVPLYEGPCFGCFEGCAKNIALPTLGRLHFCKDCLKVSADTPNPGVKISSESTPDFLLLDSVVINGQAVHWIECKAYYGSSMLTKDKKYEKLPVNKIRGQLDRYTETYGTGAVLFLQGFHHNVDFGQTMVLDATPLDLTDLFSEGL